MTGPPYRTYRELMDLLVGVLPLRVGHGPRRRHAEVHVQAMARPQVPRPHRAGVHRAGDRKILVSGFWGLSRHMNYGGEGFISLGMALAFGHFTNLWAWTYFIFVVIMITTRERYDNKFCEQMYGPEKWAEYKARVKYRINPWVY